MCHARSFEQAAFWRGRTEVLSARYGLQQTVSQHFAELHALLVKGIDVPTEALKGNTVLVESEQRAHGVRVELLGDQHGTGPIAEKTFVGILVLAALSDGAPLSLVAPMREMSMMIGALMAMAILRERVGIFRIAGCGAVIAGVTLLAS